MTKAQHKARHKMLHKCLDELVADWIDHQDVRSVKMPSNTSIMELMMWSHKQTINPTEPNR